MFLYSLTLSDLFSPFFLSSKNWFSWLVLYFASDSYCYATNHSKHCAIETTSYLSTVAQVSSLFSFQVGPSMHLYSISLGAAFLPVLPALNIIGIAALTWELFRGSSFLWGWLRAGLVILRGTLREKEGMPISLTSKHETYTLPLQLLLLSKGSHVDSPDENKDK